MKNFRVETLELQDVASRFESADSLADRMFVGSIPGSPRVGGTGFRGDVGWFFAKCRAELVRQWDTLYSCVYT